MIAGLAPSRSESEFFILSYQRIVQVDAIRMYREHKHTTKKNIFFSTLDAAEAPSRGKSIQFRCDVKRVRMFRVTFSVPVESSKARIFFVTVILCCDHPEWEVYTKLWDWRTDRELTVVIKFGFFFGKCKFIRQLWKCSTIVDVEKLC